MKSDLSFPDKDIEEQNNKAFIKPSSNTQYDELILIGGIYSLLPYIAKKIYNKYGRDLLPLKDIIQIPNQIFTGNLVLPNHIDEYESQHLHDYDFHFFKHSINISEIHNDRIKVDQVNISCEIISSDSNENHCTVLDTYPRKTFVDANYKGNFKLFFTGSAGIKANYELRDGNNNFDAKAEAKLSNESDFVFEYCPKIATISSFGNGNILNYTFRKADNYKEAPYPTGELQIFGVFMRPRVVENVIIKTSVNINNHPIPIKGITNLILTKSRTDGKI